MLEEESKREFMCVFMREEKRRWNETLEKATMWLLPWWKSIHTHIHIYIYMHIYLCMYVLE